MLATTQVSLLLLLSYRLLAAFASASPLEDQRPLDEQQHDGPNPEAVSLGFFASLERFSRLVDITYCVGTSGISKPFSCVSRCEDFPTLQLVTAWNTGVLMSDSCGYIAVDHGTREPFATSEDREGGYVPEKKGAIIVAFRGTYSVTNTVIDLSTAPQEYVPYPAPDDGGDSSPDEPEHRCHNCTVHMGFLASWQIARKEILPDLKALHEQYPGYPIYLVGHSLGGAVASLAALELSVIHGWDNMVVTTFGEPRVGNEGFVAYLDQVFELNDGKRPAEERNYRRVTHVDDPVPLLPLSEWGYRSHAGEIFISKADLAPEPSDIWPCVGDYDPRCIAGSEGESLRNTDMVRRAVIEESGPAVTALSSRGLWDVPTKYKLWELFFAHRDYFWRLGLCVPGGDPIDWGRERYPDTTSSEEM